MPRCLLLVLALAPALAPMVACSSPHAGDGTTPEGASSGIPRAAANATGVPIGPNGPAPGSGLKIPSPTNDDFDTPIPLPVPDPFNPEKQPPPEPSAPKGKKKGGTHL